ncbi:MAG: amidohydrolase family protein [Betaproteobacteria bacterium]
MRTLTRLVFLGVLLTPIAAAAQQGPPIVLRAATLLDGRGQTLHDTIVVVEGSRIARVGGAVPAGAVVYDLAGLTVMPGLIDTHTHIAYHFGPDGRYAGTGRNEPPDQAALFDIENAVATLDAGFTTIQSPGALVDKTLRDAIARGIIPGPRILTSLQPLSERSGPPEKLRELVRERKAQGADFIKLFASKSIREGGEQTMTDEQLQAACGEAKTLGLRTLVHAHSAASAKAATLAGCTSVEHGAYVTDDVFDLMAGHGTYYDPNIGLVLQNYIENKAKFFGIGNYNEEGFAFMEKGIQITLDTFKKALTHKDLKIVYGTDAVAGAHGRNYEEMIVRVRDGGQDPMAAIESATSVSAESMRMQDQIGSIAPGLQADIIAVDGDPLRDITAVGRAVFVMKGGRVFENLARGAKGGGAAHKTPSHGR